MGRIRQLDPVVVAKIAAGEVVERPSSVVKELLENSIDAGATRIDVELDQGGLDRIRIVDNGSGIDAADLPLAFSSHATSKLLAAEDLSAIATLGFRGEALASIGSVAQVHLQSRPPEQSVGAEIRCEGGTLSAVKPWGGSPGTSLEVRHLFFNIPARKKFLKAVPTEFGHVCETITKLALANPTVHFTLRHNSRLVYDIPTTATLPDRIGLFFGNEVRDALLPVDSGPGPVQLAGFVADPKCDRGTPKLQYFFVNGRWFRDRSLGHALQEAYRNLLMTGRYAVAFLNLTVPADQVDVNVHPTKAEVKFRENSLMYSLVRSVVKARLLKENLVPQLAVPEPSPTPRFDLQPDMPSITGSLFSPRPGFAEPIPVQPPEALRERSAAIPNSAMQVHDAYLVLESPEGVLLIDQHALHERILFEQFRQRVRDGQLEVQQLLIPEPVELPPEQAAAVLEVQESLHELGLDVSDFGGNTILLSSFPTLLSRRTPREILQSAIDYLMSKERAPAKEVLLDHLLATMACKAAVKAGDKLTPEEITHLLHLRQLAEDSSHCPHGRPTSLLFSRHELDRQFRRT